MPPRPAFLLRCVRALAAILLFALPASGLGADPDLALSLRASPSLLKLGTDTEALVEIEAPEGIDRLSLTASTGAIGDAEPTGPGRFRARYSPPSKRYPQVAILSAVGEGKAGTVHGWLAMPLWGSGEALIRTQPNATITVRIGDQHFGPARADSQGVAKVPIIVPPGIREGFHGTRGIDLGLPQVPHLHLAVSASRVRADRAEEVTVWAHVVDAQGQPRPTPPLVLEPKRGELLDRQDVGPGLVKARWRLPPGPAAISWLAARLEDEPTFEAVARLETIPGDPARLVISTARDRHVAGEEPIAVEATVFDAAGNRCGTEIAWETSLGQIERSPSGATLLVIPPVLGGKAMVEVKATAGGLSQTKQIALTPGPLAKLALGGPDAVKADGSARATFSVLASDAQGNPITGTPIQAKARLGKVALEPAGNGGAQLTYQAPWLTDEAIEEVSIAAAGLSASAAIKLFPDPRLTLAPKLGLVRDGTLGAPYFGAEAAWLFETFGQPFAAAVDVGGFRLSREEQVEGLQLNGKHTFVALSATLSWRKPFAERWVFWAGAGGGVALVSSSLQLADQPETGDRGLVLQGQIALGASRHLWHGSPFIEGRLLEQTSPDLANASGRLSAFMLDVGYRFEAL
jgi:hypothetical protein